MILPVETLVTFFTASVILALVPGPDNIFVLTQSALHGKTSSLWVTMGLCTGLIVHTTAVALGVAVIFQVSAVAFTLLKIVGVCYLLYLAWHALRASAAQIKPGEEKGISFSRLYRRGIIMNVTNPKVSIFFPGFSAPVRRSRARIPDTSDRSAGFYFHLCNGSDIWECGPAGRRHW